jgi:hypothetical protein
MCLGGVAGASQGSPAQPVPSQPAAFSSQPRDSAQGVDPESLQGRVVLGQPWTSSPRGGVAALGHGEKWVMVRGGGKHNKENNVIIWILVDRTKVWSVLAMQVAEEDKKETKTNLNTLI